MTAIPMRSALVVPLAALFIGSALLSAQQPPPPPAPDSAPVPGVPPGVEELTRGPVHEAFGRPVVYDPQPGPVAPKDPPPPVEEVPPDEGPAGNNVVWIPGYWGWDDEQRQFVWVSGFWRQLPPDRVWVPGYWSQTDQGTQWASGYWAQVGTTDAQYFPEPPASLETGPPGDAPSADDIWVPGIWLWQANGYVWQPGFWTTGYPDWVWTPASYSWSPLGYVFISGFWDCPLWRRGLLFAPVTVTVVQQKVTYSPRLALNTAYLPYALFVHLRSGSYYFGDYYARDYLQAGYFPWFSFHTSRFGYDPLFAHTDWVYARQHIDWEARLRQVYYARRDEPATRPARLYRDYVRGTVDRGDPALVRPLAELRTAKDLPVKLERIDAARVAAMAEHARATRTLATLRAKWEQERLKELGPGVAAVARPPVKVRLPDLPRFTRSTNVPPLGPRVVPERPVHPLPDLTRKPEPRPAVTAVRPPLINPKIETRPPQPIPKLPGMLPHPEDILHPGFDRRAAHIPRPAPPIAPAVPPVRVAPPVVPHVLPPINGTPHPGHVPLPKRK
ncbi:MAG: hypothetical protein JWO38_8155 [Gemmataceae bacterium]|nr:hypothetical protein [Gemmataceae bacterium]